MPAYHITILGSDLRQCYLAEYMHSKGHVVTCYNTTPFSYKSEIKVAKNFKQAISKADIIVGPIPFSKDNIHISSSSNVKNLLTIEDFLNALKQPKLVTGGMISDSVKHFCEERDIPLLDIMELNSLVIKNAYLTAEGLLAKIISETPFSLKQQKVLILGYGNCGFMIGETLKSMQSNITIIDINEQSLALADTRQLNFISADDIPKNISEYSIIINTIPKQILSEDQLHSLNSDCIIFDIATKPGGFSNEAVNNYGLNVISCPGIPGYYMPKTAGELIGDIILKRM